MWMRIGQIFALTIAAAVLTGQALGQAPAEAPAPAAGFQAGGFQAGGYPENYQGGMFFPATELRALPGARAQAVVAAAEFRRAQIVLDDTIIELRRGFVRSPEVKAALAEQQAAFDELNALRSRALTSLKSDSTYQATADLRDRLAEQLEMASQKKLPITERMALATVKLSYAGSITAMEMSAIDAEPKIPQARQRLLAAGKRVAELNDQLDDLIRTNPAVLAARKAVQDTRIAAAGTDALYVEARNVATVAMRYAYDIYSQPNPYVINTPIYGGYNPVIRVGYPVGYPIGYPYNWGAVPGRAR